MKFSLELFGIISLSILLIFLAPIKEGLVNGESQMEPLFIIDLDDESLNADVQPGSNNSVMATGNVSLLNQPDWENVDRFIVDLLACAEGWTVSDLEELIFTENSPEQPFHFLIDVPPTTSYSVENSVEISGLWRSEPGDLGGTIESSSASIFVDTYYDLDIASEKGNVTINAGESVSFRCRIINQGNKHDRITVEIMNLDNVDEMGWNVLLSQDKFQIGEHEQRVITVSVMTRNGTPPGDYPVELRIVSQGAKTDGEENDFVDHEFMVTIPEEGSDSESTPFAGSILFILIALIMVSILFHRRRGPWKV